MALSVGSTQLIDLGALGITGYPFTLAGWFRVPNVNNLLTLMGVGNSSSGSYHRLLFLGPSSKSAAAVSFVSSTGTASSSAPMTPGTWHHVTGVFEAANLRRVFLDGGNAGTGVQNRAFDSANQYYLGSQSADAVDVAEAAVFKVALSAPEIAQLAAGFSPLCLPLFPHLAAYQSCIRQLNWLARGPTATAAGLTAVEHPRVLHRRNSSERPIPLRRSGPFHAECAASLIAGAELGQWHLAGASGNGGQAMTAGLTAGVTAEVQS